MTSPQLGSPVILPVGQNTRPVCGPLKGQSVLIYNFDAANTVYAGYNPGIGVTDAIAIQPQTPAVMDASRGIWAFAPVGSPSINVVPGGTYMGAGPAQITEQIVASTLPSLIAAAIQAAGVPPIDMPAPVYVNFHQTIPAGGTFNTGELSFSPYQSWVGTMFVAATSAGVGTNPWVRAEFEWGLQADNYDTLHDENWVVPITPYNFTYVYRNDCQGPCYGDHLQIEFTNYDTEPCLLTIGLFGSYRTRSRTDIRGRYNWNSDGTPNESMGLGTDLVLGIFQTGAIAPNTTSAGVVLDLFAGPAFITGETLATGNVPWTAIVQPQPASVLDQNMYFAQPGTGPLAPINFLLPKRTCALFVHNSSATDTISGADLIVIAQEQPQ